jgi:hypothetical protein
VASPFTPYIDVYASYLLLVLVEVMLERLRRLKVLVALEARPRPGLVDHV